MPVVALNRSANWSDKRVNLIYGSIKTAKLLTKIFTIVGYTLGGLLLLVSLIFLIYQCYERRRKPDEDYKSLSIDYGKEMDEKED
jgi:hypothetical protein|mmetsp:Transcript_13172/g.2026  ORF Transcript_13172/g.2026 Transcript_13172/m.2026 type:complete len:85 (+) Transcript_13172:2902-3156(+)